MHALQLGISLAKTFSMERKERLRNAGFKIKESTSYAIHLFLYVCHPNSTSWKKNHQQGKPNTHQSIIYHGVRIKTTTDNLTTKFAP